MNYKELKEQIIKYGKKLGEKNMTPGTSGNISIRTNEKVLISASGTCLADLSEYEITLMDLNANVLDGPKPSSEKNLHNAIYKLRPDINSIVHCHAPFISTFAVCHIPLSKPIISENVFYFGEIPLVDYAMPSSNQLVENTIKYFDTHDAVLLANHGIIIGGKDIKDAYYKMETAEAYAQIYLQSMILGGGKELLKKDIEDIYELRKAMGKA